MKLETLKSIISKKKNKSEFAIVTNLSTGESEIFEKNKPFSKELTFSSEKLLCKYCSNGMLFEKSILWTPISDFTIQSLPIGEDIIL